MARMRSIFLGLVALLSTTTVYGQSSFHAVPQSEGSHSSPEPTLWDHGGSVVYLIANGSMREFHYKEPRQGMLDAGARRGSLLFRGKSENGQYVGTAFIFDRRCGQFPYQVSGPILDNYERVLLTGQAPRVGSNCRIQGYFSDTLDFTLLKSGEVPTSTEPTTHTVFKVDGIWQPVTTGLDDRELTITAEGDQIRISAFDMSCNLTDIKPESATSFTANSVCDDESSTIYTKETITAFNDNSKMYLAIASVLLRNLDENSTPKIDEKHNNEPAIVIVYKRKADQ